MSITRKTHIRYFAAFIVFASMILAGSLVHADMGSMGVITGKITAIDPGNNTISLRSGDGGQAGEDLVVRVDDSTNIARCQSGNVSLSTLKVGDEVTVSYYESADTFVAHSISPSQSELMNC